MTDGINADGEEMGTVEAVWGENMIGWRIKPFVARPQAQTAAASHFDRAMGAWGEIEKAIGGDLPFGRSAAIAGLPGMAPNKQTAEQWTVGLTESSILKRGMGFVRLNGEPAALPYGRVSVRGARAGVDGLYSIEEVEHLYSRSGFLAGSIVRVPALFARPVETKRLKDHIAHIAPYKHSGVLGTKTATFDPFVVTGSFVRLAVWSGQN